MEANNFSLLFNILSKSKRLTDSVADATAPERYAYLVTQLFLTKIASVIVDRLLHREMVYDLCIGISNGALKVGGDFFCMKEVENVLENASLFPLQNVSVSETLPATEIGEYSSNQEYKELYSKLLSLCMEYCEEEADDYFLSADGYERIDVEALRHNLFVSENMDALGSVPDEVRTHFIQDLLFEVLDMEWVQCEACDFKYRIFGFTPLRDIPEAFDCLMASMSTDDCCHGANYKGDGREYVSIPIGTYANLSQSYGNDAVYYYGDLLPCIAIPLYALAS